MSQFRIVPLNNWEFRLVAPLRLKVEFSYTGKVMEYNFFEMRYTYKFVECYIYKRADVTGFVFGIGFAPYILYHYGKYLDTDSKNYCRKLIDPIKLDLPGLRSDQLVDLNELLRFNRGIFQGYSSYGKTEIITALIKYALDNNESVLILTPNKASLNEIDHRLNLRYGITRSYFDYQSNYNAINVNGFPRSHQYNKFDPYWSKVTWILADEAEYDVTDTGIELLSLCTNCKRAYAFSATADKGRGDRIIMRGGNIPVVQRNLTLIHHFGFSSVFKKPESFNIELIDVKTNIFDDMTFSLDPNAEYTEIVYSIFTDPKFCKGLTELAYKEKSIFIPMFRLEVIDLWIKNYFNREDSLVINVCGRGYELYISGKYVDSINLDELKELVDSDRIDIIVGTKSSYRALNLPKLNKVLLLSSKLASNVLQCIGRVSRSKRFKIFNLIPLRNIPIYSPDLKTRKSLILKYFSECNILKVKRDDSYYGIN